MKKETFLHKFITKILKRIGLIKEYEVDKKEMCEHAKLSGACPNSCDCCVWNTEE
jgi:hypothetical protein